MSSLEIRFRDALGTHVPPDRGARLVVALSGGLDSMVLLHLLRHGAAARGMDVVAAHFDHAMRDSSAEDACWVRGLCRAWEVPLHLERAPVPPRSEADARRGRYAFLERVRERVDACLVLTAHHADDQAETVLFRAVRGTGQAGLGGIPAWREPGICRPLLGFWRTELEEYAERVRLSWRRDPTNTEVRYARNALRHRILPEIERLVAPGARTALVRLAELAREDEAGWASVLPALMEPLGLTDQEEGVSLDRAALLTHHPAVQARMLRYVAAQVGARLDETATRRALEFALRAGSGRTLGLGGACSLRRDLDRLVLTVDRDRPPDIPLLIHDERPGFGDAWIGGERVAVVWGDEVRGRRAGPAVRCSERFGLDGLRFPLTVRGREPGDRIRLPGGTKKVKKLFLERRISSVERSRAPLLVDAEGDVLWIPGVARAEPSPDAVAGGALGIGFE